MRKQNQNRPHCCLFSDLQTETDLKVTLVEGTLRQEGHDIFSSYCEFVVTRCQLTVFKPEWQRFLQTAPGSRREPGPLIDSDVFFESVLKFFI